MPEMKYLNDVFMFADYVISRNWAVNQFANLGALPNNAAHPRKTGKQIQVVK